MAKTRKPSPPMSLTALMLMALGSLGILGGLTWLALVYAHAGLIAAILPIIPVAYGFFAEQLRKSMEISTEDDEEDIPISTEEGPP